MAHIMRWDEGWRWDSGMFWGQLVPDHRPVGKARHGMAGDYIPKNRDEYRAWLLNLSTQIATVGTGLGLTAPQITAVQSTCAAQIARIDALGTSAADLQAKQAADAEGRKLTDAALREELGDWKRLPGWTAETAATLQAVSPSGTAMDESTYKPEFTVRLVGGEIRLDWKKKGVDSMWIHSRLSGQTEWVRIAVDTSSPYIDGRPLAHAGVAETREYMLRGAKHDEAIGLDSDIQSISWGGA
ncbi:MAG: hypothetical protein NTY53_17710 [Kiritimatiellaeota bacterium]|nr:hypothetical protein [Kiritimatiellota bacterium]